jgi:hypothetical protein
VAAGLLLIALALQIAFRRRAPPPRAIGQGAATLFRNSSAADCVGVRLQRSINEIYDAPWLAVDARNNEKSAASWVIERKQGAPEGFEP